MDRVKVLAGGCFDILHYGHVHYLKEAKALGDYLVVAIESDKNIKKLKGSSRPFHTQDKRKEILEYLEFVDEVLILKDKMSDADYLQLVVDIKPKIIAVTKGDPLIKKKRGHASRVNAQVVEIPKIKVASTSQIAKLLEID